MLACLIFEQSFQENYRKSKNYFDLVRHLLKPLFVEFNEKIMNKILKRSCFRFFIELL